MLKSLLQASPFWAALPVVARTAGSVAWVSLRRCRSSDYGAPGESWVEGDGASHLLPLL